MKPVRLVMQAFGPYANREVIDFREAVASGLFGIYGRTGSGKSSIFSAICFALFGAPSRADQSAPSLRSDHAPKDLPTEVEFVFDLGKKRYFIHRKPEQERPKLRGEGILNDKHEASLFDATSIAPEKISLANPGKPIAEKKVGPVKEAINNILGYTLEQFRQIVLLPQGKFESFLVAKSDERQDILRDLFDVSLYENFTETLKKQAKEAEQNIIRKRAVCEARLNDEGFATMEIFQAALAENNEAVRQAEALEKAASEKVKAARLQLDNARNIARLFAEAESATTDHATLLQQKENIEALSARLKETERAAALSDVEREHNSAVLQHQKQLQVVEKTEKLAQNTAQIAQEASKLLEEEKRREKDIDALTQNIDALGRYRDGLNEADALRVILDEKKKSVLLLDKEKATLSDQLAKLVADRDAIAARHMRLNTIQHERLECESQKTALNHALQGAKAYDAAALKLEEAKQEQHKKYTAFTTAQTVLDQARKNFDTAEKALAEAQAFHLATKLEPGKPCPVCGAEDHPQPATGSSAHQGLDHAFRTSREKLQNAQLSEEKARSQYDSAKAVYEERSTNFFAFEKPQKQTEILSQELSDIITMLSALEKEEADLGDPVSDEKQLTDKAQHIALEQSTVCVSLEEAKTGLTAVQARYDAEIDKIPETLRDQTGLERQLEEYILRKADWQKARQKAEENERLAHEANISAQKDRQAAKTNLISAQGQVQETRQRFDHRLSEAGLSHEQYTALKPELAQYNANKQIVETYSRTMVIAENRLDNAKKAVHDHELPDINLFEDRLKEDEAYQKSQTEALIAGRNQASRLEKLYNNLKASLTALEEEERATGSLRELARLCNGDNTRRLKLETYAMGAIFHQVLEAANKRLYPMSGERFTLELSDMEESGKGQRGLGIRVLDDFTGKTRPTATLSGGESFITALALALGLADVVESMSGNVRLDTIFIDEGFGSLDTEGGSGTLEEVLHTLEKLGAQNRAVGIISHVALVQETIPNGFYIEKGLTGSHIEVRRQN